MEGWRETFIKDEFFLGRGRVISQTEVENNFGIFPVYSSQSTNKGEMGKISTYDFEGEFITWTTDGAYAGTVFYRNGKFNCTNVCGTLKTIDEKTIDPLFISYLLSTIAKDYVSYIGNPKLMNGVMAKIPLVIPKNIDEQRRIAEILSTIDKGIEQTETLITKYKSIKKGLMHDLLTYGIDKNGTIRNPQTHIFVEKNGIVVPEEWEVNHIVSIADVTGGKRLPKGHEYSENRNGFKYLRVTDFYNKKIDYQNLEELEENTFRVLERYEIFNRDLFISIAGSIGYVEVLKSNIPDRIILTENALRIKIIGNILSDFLSIQINSELVQKQIWSEIGTGGGVPKLAMHRVKSLLIPHPVVVKEYDEQQKILEILEQHEQLIESEQTNLSKLQKQKQGLMQDLLTGKVRVKI